MTAAGRMRLRIAFAVVLVLVVIVEAIYDPRSLKPDGVAYLDLGDAILDGKPWAIVGYFSPLYAAWIALVVRVVDPSIAHELLTVRLANGVVILGAAAAFEWLVSELVTMVRRARGDAWSGELALRLFACALYLWSVVRNVGSAEVTPDVMVAGAMFAACALILRGSARPDGPSRSDVILLGVTLAVGYYSKSVFMVLAGMFIAAALLTRPNAWRRWLAAFGVFVLIAAPWIAAISNARGHVTFGDTGRLNLVWYGGSPVRTYTHWQGDEVGYGTPVSPTRMLMRSPEVFEFASPFPVSYPPWYDASYWFRGVELKVSPAFIAARSFQNLKGTARHLWPLALLLVAGLLVARGAGPFVHPLRPLAVLVIPAVGSYLIYAPIALYTRYVAGAGALLYLFVAACWMLNDSKRLRAASLACVTVGAILLLDASRTMWRHAEASRDATGAIHRSDDDDIRVAESLRAQGVAPQTAVAAIGTDGSFVYWPRLARLRMVAEAPGGPRGMFWRADSATQGSMLALLRSSGARLVVSDSLPDGALPRGWQRIEGSRFAWCSFAEASPCLGSRTLQP